MKCVSTLIVYFLILVSVTQFQFSQESNQKIYNRELIRQQLVSIIDMLPPNEQLSNVINQRMCIKLNNKLRTYLQDITSNQKHILDELKAKRRDMSSYQYSKIGWQNKGQKHHLEPGYNSDKAHPEQKIQKEEDYII